MYFAVWATDRANRLEARLAVRDAHRARLRDPGTHPVTVVAGGPTLAEHDGTMNGTLLIVEAQSIEQVRAFIEDDPYVLAEVYAGVDIRPWQWGLGAPPK